MAALTAVYEQGLKANPEEGIPLFIAILKDADTSEAALTIKEKTIYALGELYVRLGKAKELRALLTDCRPYFNVIAKAKVSHIVLSLIGMVSQISDTLPLQVELCEECIAWAENTRQTFLRQKIEVRLAALFYETAAYIKALKLLTNLLREIKRFDDKLLLVEIQLIESKVQHKLRNIPKAKASLTSARSAANAIYCPPLLQAQIDIQAGTLHAEEKDYKTAYSYFYEAFEGYTTLTRNDPKNKTLQIAKKGAQLALMYMLLCKIMLNSIGDVNQIIGGKNMLAYAGREMEAMRVVANAHKARSLQAFEKAKAQYHDVLDSDLLIQTHLSALEDTLLEQNLSRIIEPFSVVEIAHVAEIIDLPVPKVEKKLSQMILDKKLSGILDQGEGTLILFDEQSADKTYQASLEAVDNMGKVVDSLYEKAKKLNL